jgi:2-dehydropantoate 2-reductase
LPIRDFMEAVLITGYQGEFSLEIFNDQFRAGSPREVEVDAQRSLIYLMDQLRDTPAAAAFDIPAMPPRSQCLGVEFIEFAVDDRSAAELAHFFAGLGFRHVGRHKSKAVERWAQGSINLVLERFAASSVNANCIVKFSGDIQRERWRKFVVLTGTSGATALTRMTLGAILEDTDTRAFLLDIMQETLRVGDAEGVVLEDGFVEERLAFLDSNAPREMRTSMAHDVLRGNRLEVDWLNGHVSRLGRAHGIATPRNDAVYAGLKHLRMGVAR